MSGTDGSLEQQGAHAEADHRLGEAAALLVELRNFATTLVRDDFLL
jgi:hypothetical protein